MLFLKIRDWRHISLSLLTSMTLFIFEMNNVQARYRIGELEVRLENANACFSPAGSEVHDLRGDITFNALTVEDTSTAPYTRVWTLEPLHNTSLSLSPGSCVPYGLSIGKAQPMPLESDRVYLAVMTIESHDTHEPTHGYMAYFCLLKNADEELSVVKLNFISGSGWNTQSCGSNPRKL